MHDSEPVLSENVNSVEALFAVLEKRVPLVPNERYWLAISGSWRKGSPELEHDVRRNVRLILERGGGIVTGGALGVDFTATNEALEHDPSGRAIKVYLPVPLPIYAAHYRKRAQEGVITLDQAEKLINQLSSLQHVNPTAIIENTTNDVVNEQTYYERNTAVMDASHGLLAFQVNQSAGVGDTVEKALHAKKPVFVQRYIIE